MTLPTVELLPVSRLFQRSVDDPELRESLFSKGSGYLLYHVLDDLFDYCFPILDKIGHKLDSIEDDISRAAPRRSCATSRRRSRRSSPTARSSSLSGRRCACSSGASSAFLPEELELYFDDIVDASERIWDLLDNYKEVVEALEATNEAAIAHRQNNVLRLLTIISVTMLPLSVVASLFGMNVDFPGNGSSVAFWAILGFLVAVLAGMIGFFRYQRWL